MTDCLIKLKSIEADFYDNLDSRVAEIWKEYKFKWFFPKHRKKQIENALFMSYLTHKAMIKESYLKQ